MREVASNGMAAECSRFGVLILPQGEFEVVVMWEVQGDAGDQCAGGVP
jgi:hypothetical protein